MRKRILLISSILLIGAVGLAACGKKSPSSPDAESTTEATTEEVSSTEEATSTEEQTVATSETTEATTSETTESDIASEKDEQAKPKSGTGTFGGWVDTSSVEIQMSNGEYQTFFVEDEDVREKFNDIDEGTKISFTYGALAGQANMQILSIK